MTSAEPAGPLHGVSALGVAVGVPRTRAGDFVNFADHDTSRGGPYDAVLAHTEPIAVSGEFTTAVVERTCLLTVHAGVVGIPGRGVLAVPARSGAGKSTLTAALVRRGFTYLSDEVLAISREDATVSPFPRPITLDAASLEILGLPSTLQLPGCAEAVVPLTSLGSLGPSGGRIDAVVLPSRVPDTGVSSEAEVSIDVVAAYESVGALVEQSFNHYRDPESSLRTIAAVAARAVTLRVTYGHAPALADQLARYFAIDDQ